LDASDIQVALELEHRRKGLLWYDLYGVDFAARYAITAPSTIDGPLRVVFHFPAPDAIYDGFTFRVADQEGSADDLQSAVVVTIDDVAPGARIPVAVRYRSRGLDDWTYALRDQGVGQVRDFQLTMTTNFTGVDFPAGSISPTERVPVGATGERILWRFDNLVTGKRIGVDLPNKLNPGPLTQRVTFFAPVSLLFFLTVMVILGIVQNRNLHPMHYFFLAAAFFSFHLLLAYLVDHVSVHLAFAVSAAVSMFLVVSYLRVVGGTHFAVAQAGLAQLIYLVLFNYAFFFKGFTGLAITVGAIVTLFVLMQSTAKVDWEHAFTTRRAPAAVGRGA
ncbi:MAG: inner membrane CreD family protein, partial [Acidobacteriota bacterium]